MSVPTASPSKLPPGRSGLPLLGETLAFMGDIFGFVRQRLEQHGPVFRTHLLGHPTAILAGPAACEAWLDDDKIQREGAFPDNLQALFGGKGILPLLDGDAHAERKRLVMAGFDRTALDAYVPVWETLLTETLGRWSTGGEIDGIAALERLSIEGIAHTVLGLGDTAAERALLERLLADYQLVFQGMTALPINVPFSGYHTGLGAKDRILAELSTLASARAQSPREDAISRILSARTASGQPIAPASLVLELHHAVLAGYIVFAELACMIVEIASQDDLKRRLREEIDAASVEPGSTWGLAKLATLPLVGRVVMETKRFCPNVPLSFGKARTTFELGGYTIEKGWLVFLAVTENNRFATSFDAPESFDPDRFAAPRNEQDRHAHAYVPQGPGTTTQHKCAGADFSTWLMAAFLVHLVQGYDWTLPRQDLSLRWDRVPPVPKDGLRFTLTKRASATGSLAQPTRRY
jgi:cytochrome P450